MQYVIDFDTGLRALARRFKSLTFQLLLRRTGEVEGSGSFQDKIRYEGWGETELEQSDNFELSS